MLYEKSSAAALREDNSTQTQGGVSEAPRRAQSASVTSSLLESACQGASAPQENGRSSEKPTSGTTQSKGEAIQAASVAREPTQSESVGAAAPPPSE